MLKGAKVASIGFFNYTPYTTITSKKIAVILNLTLMLRFYLTKFLIGVSAARSQIKTYHLSNF